MLPQTWHRPRQSGGRGPHSSIVEGGVIDGEMGDLAVQEALRAIVRAATQYQVTVHKDGAATIHIRKLSVIVGLSLQNAIYPNLVALRSTTMLPVSRRCGFVAAYAGA